jgi:hypothetical protein
MAGIHLQVVRNRRSNEEKLKLANLLSGTTTQSSSNGRVGGEEKKLRVINLTTVLDCREDESELKP